MNWIETLKLSFNNLRHSKLRSWLTIIGIVIGVAAVVAIVSIGQGLQNSVADQLSGLGGDTIIISPGFSRAMRFEHGPPQGGQSRVVSSDVNLTNIDVMVVRAIPNIRYVGGVVSGRADVTSLDQRISVSIQGVDTSIWRLMVNSELESGRYLSSGDVNAVVLGSRVANDMFNSPLTTNRQVVIEGRVYKVVGILEQSGGFGSDDSTVFMPADEARLVMDMPKKIFSSITVKVTDPNVAEDVVTDIESRLMVSRHVTSRNRDFTVTSFKSITDQVSNITGIMTLFLGGIAAISLLVGGVGIANTMYMSVLERTNQIGILKALGCTTYEVLRIFIIESALLGMVGGVIGTTLGSMVSLIIPLFGAGMFGDGMDFTTLLTPQLIAFGIGFSIAIGMVSGIFPARQAAKLQPVDALRYE